MSESHVWPLPSCRDDRRCPPATTQKEDRFEGDTQACLPQLVYQLCLFLSEVRLLAGPLDFLEIHGFE
jgi:hypothetical protein